MKIKYNNTMDDIMAFAKYDYTHFVFNKRKRMLVLIGIPVIAMLLALVLFLFKRNYDYFTMGGWFVAIYMFLTLKSYKSDFFNAAEKYYKEEDNKWFCDHILEIDKNCIIENTMHGERRDRWSAVKSIAAVDRYCFIFINPDYVHIIPVNRISEGDFNEFICLAGSFLEHGRMKF